MSVRRKQVEYEQYWAIQRVVEVTRAKWHMIIDIENQKWIPLEYADQYQNPKRGTFDISTIKNGGPIEDTHQNLLAWVEQNRPDIIKEIRTFNGNNAPSAGTQAVTAEGDYGFIQTLGDGPVQFIPRMIHTPPTHPVVNDGITRSYVSGVPATGLHCEHGEFIPPMAPDTGKPLYIIYRNTLYEASDGFGKRKNVSENCIIGVFSYDDETTTFTLYQLLDNSPYKRMHIVDRNKIEIDRWGNGEISPDDPEHFTTEYEKVVITQRLSDCPGYGDTDGYGWMVSFNDERPDERTEIGGWCWLIEAVDVDQWISNSRFLYSNEVGVDGLFVFLARKGNVGYAPPTSSTVTYQNYTAKDWSYIGAMKP